MFYQDTKNYDRAIDEYKMILQIDPKHVNANHNIGWINLEIKHNYAEAEKYFTLSIKSDTLTVNAIYNRGLTYERMKKLDKAMADYHRVLRLNPSYELAKDGVGRLKKIGIKD
jgi:tetratricopeptide (TPR) repeat protein